MVINEEEKNAFTQSVMGDTECGGGEGGSAVYVTYNRETATIDVTFNELVEYFNNGKLIFSNGINDDSGTTNYNWWVLTQLQRIVNGGSTTYVAIFSIFPLIEGTIRVDYFVFLASDPDEKMMAD